MSQSKALELATEALRLAKMDSKEALQWARALLHDDTLDSPYAAKCGYLQAQLQYIVLELSRDDA